MRILAWTLRGFHHGALHGKPPDRAYSALLAALGWLLLPVLFVAQVYLLNRRAARYYLSPARDAVLAVVATATGWHITDHVAARPGTGRGKALRALVLPELCAAADAAGIALSTTAVNERLAAEYAADLPGLVASGRATWRGRAMRREPTLGPPRRCQDAYLASTCAVDSGADERCSGRRRMVRPGGAGQAGYSRLG